MGRNEQEHRNRRPKRWFIEELGVRFQRAARHIKIQVIGEDGVGGGPAHQDHEDALDQLQEAHDQVEAPQPRVFAIRCTC